MAFLTGHGRPWLLRTATVLLLIVACFAQANRGGGRVRSTEAEVRATFIYKFALFTRWPTNAFEAADSPLLIGVLGQDPIVPELEKLGAAMKAGQRRFKLVLKESGQDAPECHMLYVAQSEKERVRALLEQVKGKPVLTISDLDPFCRLGGCIRFALVDRSVTLLFNPKAAAGQGLRLSPELLAIGKIRETDKNVEP